MPAWPMWMEITSRMVAGVDGSEGKLRTGKDANEDALSCLSCLRSLHNLKAFRARLAGPPEPYHKTLKRASCPLSRA